MNSSVAVENSEAAILARVFEPDKDGLDPEAARYVLYLDFPQRDRDRMNLLAEKAREGVLTPGEEMEVENYCRVGHLLTLMQSKARMSLEKSGLDH